MPRTSPTEPKEFIIGVDDEGRLQYVYDEELVFLEKLGTAETHRASHVEPDGKGQWTASMELVGGPVLGPFALRSEALSAEVQYLKEKII